MSSTYLINMAAITVIFLWATWCALSRRVHDGVVGKLMFCCASLFALGILAGPNGWYGGRAVVEAGLHVSLALLCLRHVAMKFLWPRLVRAIRCATCPSK